MAPKTPAATKKPPKRPGRPGGPPTSSEERWSWHLVQGGNWEVKRTRVTKWRISAALDPELAKPLRQLELQLGGDK